MREELHDSADARTPAILGGHGGYHVIKKLAQGGMAEIFLARHHSVEGFQRHVVIKRILREFSQNSDFVASFLNEAKLSAQLNHSNIVQIYDLGRSEGCYFIAMEYVRGFDLSVLIATHKRRGKLLPVPVVLAIMSDVCAGLSYAHAATDLDGRPLKLIHRDVTPSNVVLALDGQAKLLDFGIAKATATGENKTKTGTVKGKFSYLAPEQVLGLEVDQRADIFSAGVSLFEMFTNRNPYRAQSEYETLMRIAKAAPVSLLSARDDIPLAFDAIVGKALAKDPRDRFQSCAELSAALDEEARAAGLKFSRVDVAQLIEACEPDLTAYVEACRGPLNGNATDLSGKVLGVGGEAPSPPESTAPDEDLVRHQGRSSLRLAVAALGILAVIAFFAYPRLFPRVMVTPSVPEATGFNVVTTPAGGAVLLDGQLLTGATPLTVSGLAPDRDHVIEVRLAGFQPAVSRMKLVGSGEHLVQMALTRAVETTTPAGAPLALNLDKTRRASPLHSEEAREPARVRVVVIPWALVTIDGKSVGETPIAPVALAPGPHVIVIENTELSKRVVKRINLARGQDALIREDLTQ